MVARCGSRWRRSSASRSSSTTAAARQARPAPTKPHAPDADGYTLLFANNGPISIAPLLQKGVDFDPLKSFAPVSRSSQGAAGSGCERKGAGERCRRPDRLRQGAEQTLLYATAGPGSLGHLSTERFHSIRPGYRWSTFPTAGQAPTTLAIFTSEVDILLTTTSDTLNEHIRSGRVKLLGVSVAWNLCGCSGCRAHRQCPEGFSGRNVVRDPRSPLARRLKSSAEAQRRDQCDVGRSRNCAIASSAYGVEAAASTAELSAIVRRRFLRGAR